MKILQCLLCFFISSAGLAESIIDSASLNANPISINFEISGKKPAVKLLTLHHPERIVIDFSNTHSKVQWSTIAKSSPLIRAIRTGKQYGNTLRLVLDVVHAEQPKLIDLGKTANNRVRLRVVWKAATQTAQATVTKPQPAHFPISTVPKRLRNVIVVIDPGHGGKDPGAIGPTKKLEKNVVLGIARRLKNIIDKEPGMKAVLTRQGDYYVGLRERLQAARKADADIFVAIHADAFINHQSNGVSVFALSQTGATSEAARWLAEKENYSELGGVNLAELNDQNGMVRSVLLDLSQTATISASVNMGSRILQEMGRITRLHNEKVEQARFVVLKSPDIPSVLVETGFISNPREERDLGTPAYQQRLALAIFKGLKGYFWEFPPYGSLLEARLSVKNHIVQRGETLSGIAARYHVPIKSLQQSNKLDRLDLKIGQKLVIPS